MGKVIFGLLLIVAAFVLLWMNEGRVNWATIARKSTAVDASVYQPEFEGMFVSLTGKLTALEPFGDDRYLRPGDYLQVNRLVEMYAWVETEETDGDYTDYTYELDWTDDPQPQESFYERAGHRNPPLPLESQTITAASARLGAYHFDPQRIQLPKAEPVPLGPDTLFSENSRIRGEYLYTGQGTASAPKLGDLRISYTAVPGNITATAFGVQQESGLAPYEYRDQGAFYRLLAGERDDAIARLQTEYRNVLWGFRVGGMLLMWLGFGLLFSPFTRLLDFVPVVKRVGKLAMTAVAFILALTISLTTILISTIVHNLWLLLFILGVLILGGGWFWRRKNQTAV